jgi:hypothetical protein
MNRNFQILTAETGDGHDAISEVMANSYVADIASVPAAWARVMLVDGVPVSFILVDPDRVMEHPSGDIPCAFITDAATRQDRRHEGHFAAIMADTFAALRIAGISIVLTHGRYELYRRLGFTVFTHHSGLFMTPRQIEERLGRIASDEKASLLVVDRGRSYLPDLLVVRDVRAMTLSECKAALLAAAALAQAQGKGRILFEYPPAPSYGSRYPVYPSPQTRFTALAMACGAQLSLQSDDPEHAQIPHADWIKVLVTAELLRIATRNITPLAGTAINLAIRTDAGDVTLCSSCVGFEVQMGCRDGHMPAVDWPSSAIAHLVTGYIAPGEIVRQYGTPLSPRVLAMLDHYFPRCWRFSRNESWTYSQ